MTSRRGVLFDVDGTLVDTTFIHTVCWAEALRQNGRPVAAAEIHHTIGMGSDRVLDRLLGEDRDRDADDAVVSAHSTLYKQWWGRLEPINGAADLVRRCAQRGLAVVLASSASGEELSALRDVLGVDDVVTSSTSKSDADESKPAPDIVRAALDSAGLEAGDAVFVGDAVWDGEAAGRAGVPFIGLACGGTPPDELRSAGALEVWRDPAELLWNFDESRLGRLATRDVSTD